MDKSIFGLNIVWIGSLFSIKYWRMGWGLLDTQQCEDTREDWSSGGCAEVSQWWRPFGCRSGGLRWGRSGTRWWTVWWCCLEAASHLWHHHRQEVNQLISLQETSASHKRRGVVWGQKGVKEMDPSIVLFFLSFRLLCSRSVPGMMMKWCESTAHKAI